MPTFIQPFLRRVKKVPAQKFLCGAIVNRGGAFVISAHAIVNRGGGIVKAAHVIVIAAYAIVNHAGGVVIRAHRIVNCAPAIVNAAHRRVICRKAKVNYVFDYLRLNFAKYSSISERSSIPTRSKMSSKSL